MRPYLHALVVTVPAWGLVLFGCTLLYHGVFAPLDPDQGINRAVPIGLVVLAMGGLGVLLAADLVHKAARAEDRPPRKYQGADREFPVAREDVLELPCSE